MANTTQKPQTDLDLTDPNGPFASILAVQPPASDVPTPLLAPAGLDYAKSVAPPAGPTLGTEEQLQAPAEKDSEQQSTGAAPSSITLRTPNGEDEGFLGKLKRFAGEGGLSRAIGSVGDALAMAAGTPEEKQIGAQSAEEQREFPLKLAQFNAEQRYRDAILGINQQKANTGQQKADTASDVANRATIPTAEAKESNLEANTAKTQYETEVMREGMFPVDPVTAHLVNRPDLAGKPVSPLLWNGLNKVLEARGLKTVDLGSGDPNDPNSGGLWVVDRAGNKINQISTVSPSATRANALLERNFHPANDASGNIIGWYNPSTREWITPTEMHSVGGAPSITSLEGGDVIPPKPTGSMMTQGQMAQSVLDQIPRLKKEITDLSDKIGPGAGRWNDFWVNKAGVNDPGYAKLNQDLHEFLSSALAKAHFGASASNEIAGNFMRSFGEAQSPEDLAARIDSAMEWMSGYTRFSGNSPTVHRTGPGMNAPGSKSTPSGGGNDPFAQAISDYKANQKKPAGGS